MHQARTRTTLAAIALLLVPALAACGSIESSESGLPAAQGQKSPDKSGDDSADKKADPQADADAKEKYDDCLRQHGVEVANGTASADQDVFEAAEVACQELGDALPVQEADPEGIRKFDDSMLKLAKCLRDLGYDFPDPDPNKGGSEFKLKPGQTSEQFQKDQAKCADEAGLGGNLITSSSPAGGQ